MQIGGLRIRRLVLEHFAPILAGIGKERVELDLTNVFNRMIIFIGPIGSGKTYILSHLQPFATVGSLDVRNADDPIIVGEDGLKMIEYEKDGHEIVITHTFTWNGKSHAKKHSFLKDGVELNPNGNNASFLELVQLEFGIDQSFLRLVRIGANVTNFIAMKATERKAFIANLLKDTEVYLKLYKNWNNDLREINTKVNILMNKITTFSKVPLEELKASMQDLEDERKEITEKVDHLKEKKARLKGDVNAILKDRTIAEFLDELKKNEEEAKSLETMITEIAKEIDAYKDLPSEKEINQLIGKTDADYVRDTEQIHETTEAYENCVKKYNQARDKKAMQGDENHIATLKEEYANIVAQMESIARAIDGFQCKYSTSQLESLLEDLNSMNMVVNQICQYDQKSISFVFYADSSIIEVSNRKVEILTKRKFKVQGLMNNLQFSNEYQAIQPMFRPPFCPTDTCPYFATHPVTIKRRDGKKAHFEPKLIEYQEELKDLDIDIYKYSEYPFLYSKITSLKEYWRNLSPILKDIHALRVSELRKILELSNYQSFYDYDKIIDTIDLVKKRNLYYELTEKIKAIKNELNQIDIHKDENLDIMIQQLAEEKERLEKILDEREKSKRENYEKLQSLNDLYIKLSNRTQVQADLNMQVERRKFLTDLISEMEINYKKIQDITNEIAHMNQTLTVEVDNLNSVIHKIDDLRTKINDITYTSKELDEILQEQKWMTLMVDAVGSKKGIPMKMVKIFFDSCRQSINDMLYMVSGDDFEILDFKIGEKEFTIPYLVNGIATDDISKASQGQTSLASLALSFALVKELALRSSSNSCEYNIPLLDEPDAQIRKSDRYKLLAILMKYLEDIQSEQCFIISHNYEETFYGADIQLVLTSPIEVYNQTKYPGAIIL